MVQTALKPTVRRFTVAEFERLGTLGFFREDDRVELIKGEIIDMAPIGEPHAWCVRRLGHWLIRRLGDAALVDMQNPVVLGEGSQPQPDIAVLKPRDDLYRQHPRAEDVLLLIEVADSSLDYDRQTKVPLYARSGIPETWLVALPEETLYVYREPSPDGYREIRIFRRGDTIAPLAFPDAALSVSDLLG
jgi:Uma2 family endonuclease